MRGLKARAETDPAGAAALGERLIKNTYRTLMTRGMKGCYVYCCDAALGAHLRGRVEDWVLAEDASGAVTVTRVG